MLFAVFLATCSGSLSALEVIRLSTVKGFYTTALHELASEYSKQHPNIRVEINLQPDNFSLVRYYIAQMAADRRNAPDIVHGNLLGPNENFHAGRFLELNDWLDQPNPYASNQKWRDLFEGHFLDSLAIDGVHYCILPLSYVDVGMYYNRELFQRSNIGPPQSWEEWVSNCAILRRDGVIPISICGNASGDLTNWLSIALDDACMRQFVPDLIAQPGDWNHIPANDEYVQDLENPNDDEMVTINPERLISKILDGHISWTAPLFFEAHQAFADLTRQFQFGFIGTDQAGSYNLFLTQQAACWMSGSWRVGGLMRDLAELPMRSRFDWAVFYPPPLRQAKYLRGPLRGIGGAGNQFSVVNKNDDDQHRRVIDFLMFLYSPKQSAKLVARTLEAGEYIQGAPMIKGIDLPEEIAARLKGFGGTGYQKLDLLPFYNDQEHSARLRPLVELFMLNRLSTEEFLSQKQGLIVDWAHRQIRARGYDLDPRTKDRPR